MRPIRKKLDQWVEVGLLHPEQAQAIAQFEQKDPHKNWAILGVAGIGIAAFVTGVISLIAGNWETISVTSKLIAYFMIQLSFGAIFLSARNHPGAAREISLACFCAFFLGGIFLTRQIYGLKLEPWQVFLFWIAMVLPPTLLSKSRVTYHLWVGGFYSSVMSFLFYVWATAPQWLPATFMCGVGLIYLGFSAGALRISHFHLPSGLRHALLYWSTALLLCGVTPIANALWYQESIRPILDRLPSFAVYTLIPWGASLTAVAALLLSRPSYRDWFKFSTLTMLLLVNLFLTLPLILAVGEQRELGCLGFILIWTTSAAAAGFAKWKRLFDAATLIISVRFIMLYLESFHADSRTALGLMLSGTLILVVAFVWHRYRGKVEAWLAARS